MAKHGKKYLEAAALIEKGKAYPPEEAVGLAKKTSYSKFDETVELHLRMGLDPRNANQQVRGVTLLPHGLGKTTRVLVFAQGDAEKAAKEAGADIVGGDDLVQKVNDGFIDFDTAIATPDMMGKVGRLGKVLGRKGLMPNPKSGTVVSAADIPQAVKDARKGRLEFRLDKTAIIHVPVGKVSFTEDKLMDNLTAVVDAVIKAKPTGAKGQYIKTASLNTSQGPGIELDLKPTLSLSSN